MKVYHKYTSVSSAAGASLQLKHRGTPKSDRMSAPASGQKSKSEKFKKGIDTQSEVWYNN